MQGTCFVGGLDKMFMASIQEETLVGDIPESVFAMFQLTFAIITPALIVGGFAERIRFSSMLIFSILWSLSSSMLLLLIGYGVEVGSQLWV